VANTVGNYDDDSPSNTSCLVTPTVSASTVSELLNKHPTFSYSHAHAVNHIASSPRKSTMRLTDSNTGRHYLVDSGAEVSVFPANDWDRQQATTERLLAANGSSINAYGKREISLHFGASRYTQ
jgi:hypothetical protein